LTIVKLFFHELINSISVVAIRTHGKFNQIDDANGCAGGMG